MTDSINFKTKLEKRLASLYVKEVLLTAAEAVVRSVSTVMLLFFTVTLLELISRFDSDTRTFLWFVFIIASASTFVFYFAKLLFYGKRVHKGANIEKLAEKVGFYIPGIQDELKNAYQLVNASASRGSDELAEAAFESVYRKTESIDFKQFADKNGFFNSLKFFLPALLLSAFIFVEPISSAAGRIIDYGTEYIAPAKYHFVVKPGNSLATKGDNVNFSVTVLGRKLNELTLFLKSAEDYKFKKIILSSDSGNVFNYLKKNVRNSLEYFAAAENEKSEHYTIRVVNRPIVAGLDFEIIPPKYSRLPAVYQKDNGNISALKGSAVNINLMSNKILKNATIVFSDSERVFMHINGENAKYSFKIFDDIDYYFALKDTFGIESVNPVLYSINTLEDSSPFIEFLNPKADVTLGETDLIPLILKLSDDYGFSGLRLYYKLSSSNFKETDSVYSYINIPFKRNEKEEKVVYRWDLAPMALAENDVVTFYAELKDNDYVSGPKSARTKTLNLRVPTLDELFAKAEAEQQESAEDLTETFEEAKKLNEEMHNLSNQLKRNDKKIDWEEKEKIERTMNKIKELQNKISDIAKQLEEMQKQLEENKLLSPETLQKYDELQKLFDELTGEEMKKAMEQMQNMLTKLNREQIQQSLKDMKFSEEALKNSLKRTINLLKRIQVEQKLDEVIKRAEDIAQKQEKLNSKTHEGSLTKKEKEQLAKEQEALKENLRKLKNEMDKLRNKMSELTDMPNDMMKKITEEFEKQNNDELAENAKEKIEMEMMKAAASMQQKIMGNMQKMQKKMNALKEKMQMQNQVKALAEMMQLINELVELSKQEEELKNLTEELGGGSPKLGNIAREQNKKISALNKIISKAVDLSQKTFAITPEMGKAMGMARNEMAQAISQLQNRNASVGVINQKGAMKYLNEAAQQMQNSMANMMNPGQGGGMMSLMQQMQQLSQRQMSLNQMTKSLTRGEMSLQKLAQMQRIAQQQQMIRKSLEELNKEIRKSGEAKKLTGNLEKILEEMREVVSGLNTRKLDDNLVKKQDRILSRLLDAQRSINERDFEKNRESTAGREFNINSPPEILLQTEEGRNLLRDRLLKAIRAGYAKDYEELIRKYFKNLEENYEKN